ncbi:MAG: clostripain-related cysteine peptidase, partial [Candidatus Eremiobacterota bacterium]
SATDLTKMDALTKSVDAFAKTIIASGEKSAIRTAFRKGDKYGGGYDPYKDLKDLNNLAENVSKAVKDPAVKEAAANVQKAFKDAIIANESSPRYPGSAGLTIYAPTNSGSGVGYGYQELAFAKDTKWSEALKEVGKAPGIGGGYSIDDGNGSIDGWGSDNMFSVAPADTPAFLPDGSPFPVRKNKE